MLKKKTVGSIVAILALAGTLLGGGPANAVDGQTTSAARAIPGLTCNWQARGVTSSGQLTERHYTTRDSVATISTEKYNPGRLSFVPRAVLPPGGAGGIEFVNESFYANSSDGGFYSVTAIGPKSYNDVKVTATRMAVTWGQTRLMVASSKATSAGQFIYGLTDSGALGRYVFNGAGGPKSRVVVGNSGWQGIKTLAFDREGVVAGTTRTADVLLATTIDGRLVEYTIPHDKPAQWSRRDLKSATWGNFKYLGSATCGEWGKPNQPRMLLGVLGNGDVYLYLDKRNDDSSGADIIGYGKIASGWTEKLY
ncbi:hypothetical protein [Paeniglutamicibacter terrestris]|uniref:Uncharacterized protein n=1 Tax=Paeniglutamicibacter terrestris TaxID=2723403 RepID=A0ABX1G5A8_9MICC|nr:hypothetical protein [Paeniglutamicibacter terrestris]ASN40246.1 hypothetical protein CGQ24_15360 [Arthrobacter sp. 7749]NKG21419.1 hypothetical protein [Paeniglutamicibacter terrestris]